MNELVLHSIAESFANAVFQLALEQNCQDDVLCEITEILQIINSDDDFKKFLLAPFISNECKINVVSSAFENKVSTIVFNFMCVLINHNRVDVLSNIRDEYSKMLDKHNGLLWVDISLSEDIDSKTEKNIIENLAEATGKKIRLEKKIDPTLIGGAVICCDNKVIDNSVKGSLERAVKKIRNSI